MIPVAVSSRRQKFTTLVVFCGFLLIGGALTFEMVVNPFMGCRAAREWNQTPCRILSSEIKDHFDSDGTTYSVEISYTYEVDGREYRSNRYQFLRGSSSGYQSKAAAVGRYRRGTWNICYVDPKRPSEAVLDRSFASVGWFGLIPAAFTAFGAAGIVSLLRTPVGVAAEVSWQSRPDWVSGRIKASAGKLWGGWFFTALWNAISIPMTVTVVNDRPIQHGDYMQLLIFLFPAFGAGIFLWTVRETLRWARYGRSIFEMEAVPGVVGRPLKGAIRLDRPLRPEGPVLLRLKCVSRFTATDSEGTSTKEAVAWKQEQAVEVTDLGHTIPVVFQIPADAEPTTVVRRGDGILWRLEAEARVPGPDYTAQFELPVFGSAAP